MILDVIDDTTPTHFHHNAVDYGVVILRTHQSEQRLLIEPQLVIRIPNGWMVQVSNAAHQSPNGVHREFAFQDVNRLPSVWGRLALIELLRVDTRENITLYLNR